MNNDFYMIFADGEPVEPDNFCSLLDCWTAEAVQIFLEHMNPERVYTVERVELMPISTAEAIQ